MLNVNEKIPSAYKVNLVRENKKIIARVIKYKCNTQAEGKEKIKK